jgi:outer membrane biosynthesis protein TonB
MGRIRIIALAVAILGTGCFLPVRGGGGIFHLRPTLGNGWSLLPIPVVRGCDLVTENCSTAAERQEAAAEAAAADQQRQRDIAMIHATGERLEREKNAATPPHLLRAMVSAAIDKVRPRVMACQERTHASGRVVVWMQVDPDGHAATITIRDTPDPALGDCVVTAMQDARFLKTQTGGSFHAPFVF